MTKYPYPVSIGLNFEQYQALIRKANEARLHSDAYVHQLVVEHLSATALEAAPQMMREAAATCARNYSDRNCPTDRDWAEDYSFARGKQVAGEVIAEAIEALSLPPTSKASGSGSEIPNGWKLVPIEPTSEMLNAELGLRHWDNLPSYESRRDLRPHIYKAMITAAPLPAPPEPEAE